MLCVYAMPPTCQSNTYSTLTVDSNTLKQSQNISREELGSVLIESVVLSFGSCANQQVEENMGYKVQTKYAK